MGKERRQRKKLHTPAKEKPTSMEVDTQNYLNSDSLKLMEPETDIFKNIKIDFNSLKKNLVDDTKSVKSFKSLKSSVGDNQILKKKEKLKLRKELLLKKIDTVNQLKKQHKQKNSKKKKEEMEDSVFDYLQDLASSLNNVHPKVAKPKGIEKAKKRKKNLVEGVKTFKKLMENSNIKKNPFEAVSAHIKNIVDNETLTKKVEVTKNKCDNSKKSKAKNKNKK